MLQEIHPDSLWIADIPFRLLMMEAGVRMTVVRLGRNDILVISPVDLTPQLRSELNALGEIKFIIAPNKFHFLCVAQYAEAFPDAQIFVAPEVTIPCVKVSGILHDAPDSAWSDALDQTIFRGNKLEQEAVFLHRASRTLIITDLCFNLHKFQSPLQKLQSRLFGVHRKFGPSRFFRLMMRDKKTARTSLDRILRWDFERVIMAHGDVLENGGKAALRRAFDWL